MKYLLEFIVKHCATRWQYEMDEQIIQDSFHDPHFLLHMLLNMIYDMIYLIYIAPFTQRDQRRFQFIKMWYTHHSRFNVTFLKAIKNSV
jgi:hypothetical protein